MILIGAGVLAAALVVGGISMARRSWMFDAERAQAVAMQMCSCVFVSGRRQADCRSDFPSDNLVGLEVTVVNGAVRATGAGGQAGALYSTQHGCRPDASTQ